MEAIDRLAGEEVSLGPLNGHAVGIIMKELVQRAMDVIRRERFLFVAEDKVSTYKKGWDVVTSADKKAQAIVLRTLTECFPGVGIVAEENELSIPCTLEGIDAYFTVDPLDGTKAFVRRQSHGIGTMLSLVVNGQVVAAYVGDVMTQELYGFRPESTWVHRMSQREGTERLTIDGGVSLSEQLLLMREMPYELSGAAGRLCGPGGPFRQVEVGGGSIGIQFARLWKREAGAVLLAPGTDMPWDLMPVLGISEQLDFVFLSVREGAFSPAGLTASRVEQVRDTETIVVHRDRVVELTAWVQDAL